jgi:putative pyruvate formate lyase activating enzyme
MVHIAEEAPINPCLLLNLAGCGLRCRFCQQSDLLDPASVEGAPLDASLWDTLETTGARSMAFAGGNPDESLYAILQFLATAPADWMLPIVWNCHGAATFETVALLDGVVDVYLPDFKYGADLCGRQLSGIADYPETAQAAIAAMLAQGVPVIVRLLVLPGHGSCCHIPVLERLVSLPGTCLVSVRGQYCPDFRVTPADGMMARRPTWEEVEVVREKARQCGLRIIK